MPKALAKWIDGVRASNLSKATDLGGNDLLVLMKADEKTLSAAQRFEDYMRAGAANGLGRDPEFSLREVILLGPSRRDFHELLGLFGWLSPDLQGVYWHNGTVVWTNTYYNDVTAVALEFHTGDTSPGAVFEGINANVRNPTAMQQQVCQLAANALITNYYGAMVSPAFAGAMAINLVIDVFGECATRVDGDLRQRRTEAREVFVPGGQSEGGMLPTNWANSRFRTEEGRDRFIEPLKGAQSAGATQAKQERKKGKLVHFQLKNDSESQRMVISAPFLGTPAGEQPPVPEAFHGDAAEFFRAYRSCFVHWLKTEGAGSKKKSPAAFAALLAKLGEFGQAEDLEAAILEVYGLPLSSEEPSKKDLEGRFLSWLSKK